jgi:hypothetical protein
MVRILSICRHCGDVEVTLDDISVQVWIDTDHGEYTLQCPNCANVTVWPATPETVDLLVASGAVMETVARGPGRPTPTGTGHRPRTSSGPDSAARRRRRILGHHPRRRD